MGIRPEGSHPGRHGRRFALYRVMASRYIASMLANTEAKVLTEADHGAQSGRSDRRRQPTEVVGVSGLEWVLAALGIVVLAGVLSIVAVVLVI